MKKNNNKLSWTEIESNEKYYIPERKFIKVYNRTMKYIINKTNLQTAMLYYVIYSHYNKNDNSCFPDLKTLSEESGISVRTVQDMIKKLKENKIIDYESGRYGGRNKDSFPLEKVNYQQSNEIGDDKCPDVKV